jgi:hypothetical protein
MGQIEMLRNLSAQGGGPTPGTSTHGYDHDLADSTNFFLRHAWHRYPPYFLEGLDDALDVDPPL